MEFLYNIWDILTGHRLLSPIFFIGFTLFIIGGRLNYKVEEEKFNRRTQGGGMAFDSFKQANATRSRWGIWKAIGKLGLWITVFSLLGLLLVS
ncbi:MULTISPECIES: hypothetical protein [Flavobacteriaceae]|uniref:hypothetical protein n=1 Tax=Flavobacteriaceae TaxID=49546 RepID=UPI002349976E|nr:hypothetical protein [Muricauda sp. SP22]MDC6361393.1 hypothetical protein [Muricauda sp. SP22]